MGQEIKVIQMSKEELDTLIKDVVEVAHEKARETFTTMIEDTKREFQEMLNQNNKVLVRELGQMVLSSEVLEAKIRTIVKDEIRESFHRLAS